MSARGDPAKLAETVQPPRRRSLTERPREAGANLTGRPLRPALLASLAAAAGLLMAAGGLYRPAHMTVTTVPAGDVALVNQEPILMSDFVNELEQKEGIPFSQTTPQQKTKMLHEMVDQELLVQRALALDLPEQDTDSRASLEDGVNALVAAPVLADRPSDDALKAFFGARQDRYATHGTMTLVDLVLHVGGFENADQSMDQGLADATEAGYQIRSGADIEQVKQHFGLVDSGKVSGIEPDFSAKLHLGPKLYGVAEGLSDGAVSAPVADSDGVHLLIMQHRQPPVFGDFDKVRNNVYADYENAEKTKAKQANLQALRARAQILLAPGQGE